MLSGLFFSGLWGLFSFLFFLGSGKNELDVLCSTDVRDVSVSGFPNSQKGVISPDLDSAFKKYVHRGSYAIYVLAKEIALCLAVWLRSDNLLNSVYSRCLKPASSQLLSIISIFHFAHTSHLSLSDVSFHLFFTCLIVYFQLYCVSLPPSHGGVLIWSLE